LHQIFDYLQLLKKTNVQTVSNRNAILQYAGVISDADTVEIHQIIDDEFSKIEGEW
jgi:hypothetical protein